jgi:hypothetical protein
VAVFAATTACSSGNSDELAFGGAGAQGPGGATAGPSRPGSPAGPSQGGAAGGGSTDVPPRPETGPGSKSSAARSYFLSTVHAPLQAQCGSCHSTGALGAPKILDANPELAYIALDNRALIRADSILVTKGQHAGGAGPALSGEARTSTLAWLEMEATERVGKAAPVNLLKVAADCADMSKFPTQPLTSLLTTRRTGENNNNCTGCDRTQCASCHLEGEANVAISDGRTINNTEMLSFYKTPEGISRFIGLDRTKLVESKIFETKSKATVDDQRNVNIPKHPQYVLDAARTDAIRAFAQAIITKFDAGQCPNQPPR